MLKAPVVLPNGEKTYPARGTPQGGILSPLLANIVLNELDWWIASQWEQMPTKTKFKTRSNVQGTEIKSHAYRALRRSRLKEMHAVRYADDFKIFCATHEDAVRAYKATELWLKDRLGLEISPDKSKVVNLKRQYSDFLGFKLKIRKKGKKYVVRSHMSDKAYKKAHEKVSEEVKKLAHSSDDNAQFMQLQKYNSVVAGLHEYYCISTEVSHDFSRLAFSINKQLRNRLKGDLSKKGQLRNGFIKEKYGASRQMRFLHGRPVVPLGYVQSKNAQHKRKSINKYTVKGREQIHKNLAIDTATMLWLMRNPVKGRTIEYADNRISLYAAQYGKCAVTGIPMNSHDIHCHHKVPVSNGGSDEYANLILVSKAVHILIHASSEPTIEKYQLATDISIDCGDIGRTVNTVLKNRLKSGKTHRLKKEGRDLTKMEIQRYGKSEQLRYIAQSKEPIYPISYVQCKNPMSQRRKVCAYTAAGRSEIHDDLRINTFLLLQLMRAPTYSRSTEYADNRIPLFSAQWGKCAVTGKKFQCISEIHCHHKKPKGIGGSDKYENLVLVLAPVHELIHAVDEDTIRSYLTALKLDTSQLTKLNKLRTLAKRKPIDLEKPNLTNNSHNGMTKETKKSV